MNKIELENKEAVTLYSNVIQYINHFGLVLCAISQHPNKGIYISKLYYAECPSLGLKLSLTNGQFHELEEDGFEDWTIEQMFNDYQYRYTPLWLGDLQFQRKKLNNQGDPPYKTYVKKVNGLEIMEIELQEEKL